MKTLFTITVILILMILFTTCDRKEDSAYMGDGVITGFDPRDCACCGGLLINLNSNSTELITDSTYQVDHVPGNFNIDVNTIFPVFLKLDYEKTTALCGKTINIIRFEIK